MTKIKICGLMRDIDIAAVNEVRPDFAGFIMSKPFRRCVSPENVKRLRAGLSSDITVVGVFVNETAEHIAKILNAGIIDMAQLHGDEDNEYIEKLRSLTTKPLIKAFKIRSEQNIKAAQDTSADLVLLDSGAGSGETFDWRLIKDIGRPYLLAGGLSADNASDAVRRYHPYGVDVSSGVETDGVKDREKIQAFCYAVRNT
jgi:phosphoribosylanthranilate isomerase